MNSLLKVLVVACAVFVFSGCSSVRDHIRHNAQVSSQVTVLSADLYTSGEILSEEQEAQLLSAEEKVNKACAPYGSSVLKVIGGVAAPIPLGFFLSALIDTLFAKETKCEEAVKAMAHLIAQIELERAEKARATAEAKPKKSSG